ncbi:MAG TPA: DNA repair protein RecN [Aeromicrobium sp.]|nr:DNA repair protein RecN [Aeromicrobium sp.]
MWNSLRLESLGVIEEAELELGSGFTVITGETGAGKTMVVTALGLLRGERADLGLVRRGADRARIEASLSVPSQIAEIVKDAGGEVDDELVVARILTAQGRTRAVAGGATVPAALLARIADELVAVHGQSDQQRLVRPQEQRLALDRFAATPVEDLLSKYRPQYAQARQLRTRIEDLQNNSAQRLQRLDLLRHGLAEIDEVEPVPGEDEALAEQEDRLAHAEGLLLAATNAAAALSDDDNSAVSALATARTILERAGGHDAALDQLTDRLEQAAIELSDVASELSSYAARVDLDPNKLAAIGDRRSDLAALKRRFGPTLADVLDWAANARLEIAELDFDDSTVAELEQELQAVDLRVIDLAAQLTKERQQAAERFVAEVSVELAELTMPSARLEVRVTAGELGPFGADEVEIWFAANSGAEPRPLARAASGGELSRLMLAIEVVLAGRDLVPTLVFDEVDAGIGGRTAVEVGRRLARLAKHAQVIAVTHLPQVAAFADSHFVVSKSDDGSVTRSSVVKLQDDSRVEEVARMLAGVEDSESAREHARELLELAASG